MADDTRTSDARLPDVVGRPLAFRYRSAGITIRCDRRLPGVPECDEEPESVDDLTLVAGSPRAVPGASPDGERVVDAGEKHKNLYSAVRDEHGFLFRFFGKCDIRLTDDLRHGEYRRDPGADEGLIDVLLAGTLLAFVVALKGACVLHASAVEVDGQALGFVGHSGMGKSTLTVATCAAGALLVAEDVLAVDTINGVRALAGNTDIRLREGSVSLLDRLPGDVRLKTPDGRYAVAPPRTLMPSVPLDTLVIPQPSRRAKHLSVTAMSVAPALFRLINFPRVIGLCEPGVVRRQFEGAGTIAQAVPVLVATVPWGPPFMPDLGERLLELMTHRA